MESLTFVQGDEVDYGDLMTDDILSRPLRYNEWSFFYDKRGSRVVINRFVSEPLTGKHITSTVSQVVRFGTG